MKAIPIAEAKAKLSQIVDRIEKYEGEIMITRNGHDVAVLMSPEEYEGLKETRAIKNDAEFIKEIKGSLKKYKKGASLYSLEDLFGK
ncbi:MAG: type II toxin-antitoxin system Phd/YefM family antitoxin [Spirochaetes bacterium]|nr:type II toxin-antitoxin system Phd/YefM family antitoxin [Spirochaetota bacterium]